MGGKKLKTSNGDGLSKRHSLSKSKRKKNEEEEEEEHSQKIVESDEKLPKLKERKKKDKSSEKRRNSLEESVTTVEMKKSKLKNKKRQREKVIDAEIGEPSEEKEIAEEKQEKEGEVGEEIVTPKKSKKTKRKNDKIGEADAVNNEVKQQKGKSKKARKAEKKDQMLSNKNEKEKARVEEDYEVYELSSGDEDLTAGMTKWVSEYHKSRPGLDILQQRIDDFIADHDAKEEQAREEKEACMAEDGWTFVGPQKGRKKTADSDGVVVGSVAEAAVRDKVSKKETKLVGSDFYRFQKREAHRNEIMKLQSKFEEDKKRIQQMRATRKFRPY